MTRQLGSETIHIFKVLLANRFSEKKVSFVEMMKHRNSKSTERRGWLDRISHSHWAGERGPKLATKHRQENQLLWYELSDEGAKYILDHPSNLNDFSKEEICQLQKIAALCFV